MDNIILQRNWQYHAEWTKRYCVFRRENKNEKDLRRDGKIRYRRSSSLRHRFKPVVLSTDPRSVAPFSGIKQPGSWRWPLTVSPRLKRVELHPQSYRHQGHLCLYGYPFARPEALMEGVGTEATTDWPSEHPGPSNPRGSYDNHLVSGRNRKSAKASPSENMWVCFCFMITHYEVSSTYLPQFKEVSH